MTGAVVLALPVRGLAAEINTEHKLADRAVWNQLQHARRCGELLREQKEQLPHGRWLSWLDESCPNISPQMAQRYMRIDRRWAKLEAANASRVTPLSIREALQVLADGVPRVARNSGDFEWNTPVEILDAARQVLGLIDLDPASNPNANNVVQAKTFYTIKDNGLAQQWRGTIFLNPPYAQPLVTQFCQKLADSVRSGAVPSAIVVLNNSTETKHFDVLAAEAAALCFPTGRVRFWKPNQTSDRPMQGQVLVYLGSEPGRFCEVFSRFGVVAKVWRAGVLLPPSAAR